jgi:L-seryl-tRNA(Ser) seleniumtransferase
VFVNNNAAAVLLALNEIGGAREAIVSRGELIEIGGAFRLPDIMKRAGVKLVEVGTTNRTHLRDYENAINDNTALILKAHTSNYLIQGFTASVPEPELAKLAKARGIVFINDLGSGTLVDLARYGLRPEPTVQQALEAGADLVTFSGDKLLGGPQCGIIAGRKDFVARIAKNPMKRALRLDKIRLAALEATLKLYRDPERLPEALPTLRAFVRERDAIAATAERLAPTLAAAVGVSYEVGVCACSSQIGSGALPLETLPSAGIAIRPDGRKGAGRRLEAIVAAFRSLPIPVIGRVSEGAFILDLRCLEDAEGFTAQLPQLKIADGGADA